MGATRQELGVGLAAIGPRPYVNESRSYVGQAWASRRISRALRVSGIAAADSSALAAGGALAWLPLRSPLLSAGFEAELGYAFGALSMPMAVSPSRWLTIYTAPRVGNFGDVLTPSVPLGASFELPGGFALRTEAKVSWADLSYYNRRLTLGLALAYQFDVTSR